MVPGCRCAPQKSLIVPASKPTARPKPAKPSSSPSGRRNRAMRKANQCATEDRSLIRPRLKAQHSHIGQHKEARECVRYLWNNRHRMRYPKFHKQGFCTSTGVVETGCKVVIGTRLKRAGMHWTVKGANTIIALRCSRLSGRFEDFWERCSDQRKTAA